jgi:type IV pilus assembly protein PilY1
VWVTYGGNAWIRATNYLTAPGMTLASLPTYDMTNIKTMMWVMPRDALSVKDWSGTGVMSAGLIPTVTKCVRGNTLGKNGEWRNGALTVQIIRDDTPDSAVELNNPTAGAKDGYRLKYSPNNLTYLLAEYTVFWHYSGVCYGASGWVPAPTSSPKSTLPVTAPLNTFPASDPGAELFAVGGSNVALVSVTTTVSGGTTTIVQLYSDGSTITETRTDLGNGKTMIRIVHKDSGGTIVADVQRVEETVQNRFTYEKLRDVKSGRVSWRELRGE